MYRISLINMPFSNPALPSIALTQLRSVVEQRCGDRVRVRILYLNHDFAQFTGAEFYQIMSGLEANNSGLGDWFFRRVAFPQQPDNTQQFFQRYFPYKDEAHARRKGLVLGKRAAIETYMRRLIAIYRLDKEDLLGFASMFAQTVACLAMASLVKKLAPNVVTVMGGANCEIPMGRELARHAESIDFVFSGPALVSFPQFVEYQVAGEIEKCQRIAGVLCRPNLDSEHIKGHGAIGQELPIDVPVPLDYESFLSDLERNFPDGRVKPSLTFETSRGCWWGQRSHCTFCGLNSSSMVYRSMPSEQALELFRDLFSKYGDRCSRFSSVDNILPREYLKDVFPHLETPAGATMFYEVKADLKPQEMAVLSEAGVTEIQPGIESLASSTLRLMGKGTTAFQNLHFLKNCIRYGIKPAWNFLIGFPGEGEEVYEKYLTDLPLLVHLPPPSGAFPVRFDRYSPYFTRTEEYGLELSPYEFYRLIYPFGDEALENMAYYFEDRNYKAKYMTAMISWKDRLSVETARWNARWLAADGGLTAQLYVKQRGNSAIIHDSRSGELIEHEVDGFELQILDYLYGRGLRTRNIARHLKTDDATVEATIARLRQLGLLFEENQRFMSLVLLGARAADFELVGFDGTAVGQSNSAEASAPEAFSPT